MLVLVCAGMRVHTHYLCGGALRGKEENTRPPGAGVTARKGEGLMKSHPSLKWLPEMGRKSTFPQGYNPERLPIPL